jgi:hypothetical protein
MASLVETEFTRVSLMITRELMTAAARYIFSAANASFRMVKRYPGDGRFAVVRLRCRIPPGYEIPPGTSRPSYPIGSFEGVVVELV